MAGLSQFIGASIQGEFAIAQTLVIPLSSIILVTRVFEKEYLHHWTGSLTIPEVSPIDFV